MKTNLFGKSIEKACEYCEHGRLTADRQVVICSKHGSKAPYESCSLFEYSPLKRRPAKFAHIQTYDKKDFEL